MTTVGMPPTAGNVARKDGLNWRFRDHTFSFKVELVPTNVKSSVGFGWRIKYSCSLVTSSTGNGDLSQSGQSRFPIEFAKRKASAIRTASASRIGLGAAGSSALAKETARPSTNR